MVGEPRHVEDLEFNGVRFAEDALRTYRAVFQEKDRRFDEEDLGPAFRSQRWKRSHQRNRGLVCRAIWHGYHQLMCKKAGC